MDPWRKETLGLQVGDFIIFVFPKLSGASVIRCQYHDPRSDVGVPSKKRYQLFRADAGPLYDLLRDTRPMTDHNHTLDLISETFAIIRLDPQAEIPTWAHGHPFECITRTTDETSILCPQASIPDGVPYEGGFRCLKLRGPFGFSEFGILDSLVHPLAKAGVSIVAVCTFDTDYLFVREADLERSFVALSEAGHTVLR